MLYSLLFLYSIYNIADTFVRENLNVSSDSDLCACLLSGAVDGDYSYYTTSRLVAIFKDILLYLFFACFVTNFVLVPIKLGVIIDNFNNGQFGTCQSIITTMTVILRQILSSSRTLFIPFTVSSGIQHSASNRVH